MSGAQLRRSRTVCSFMVGLLRSPIDAWTSRTISLPLSGWAVLGADLKCSESYLGAAVPIPLRRRVLRFAHDRKSTPLPAALWRGVVSSASRDHKAQKIPRGSDELAEVGMHDFNRRDFLRGSTIAAAASTFGLLVPADLAAAPALPP